MSTPGERSAAAAILGELIPELEYAAPVLLDRIDRGLPLVNRQSPTDLGFETGTIDAQVLDLFRVLAPYVTAALSYGMFGIVQRWLALDRAHQSEADLRSQLTEARARNEELRRSVDSMAKALSSAAKMPVTPTEIDEAIGAAIARLRQEQR